MIIDTEHTPQSILNNYCNSGQSLPLLQAKARQDAMPMHNYNPKQSVENWIQVHGLLSTVGLAGLDGLGDDTQLVSTIGTGATATTAVLGATGAIAASTVAIALPVVGAVVAAAIFWLNRKGPTQKIETTKIVSDAEPVLKQNLAAWLSLTPQQKTRETQKLMLSHFNAIWEKIVQLCNDKKYGDPGQNCIHDRQRGGKWDWFGYYYDPIANDTVVEDAQASQGLVQGTSGGMVGDAINGMVQGSYSQVLVMGLVVLAGIVVLNNVEI